MFTLRRRAKPQPQSAQSTRLSQQVDESTATYEFVATFDAAASNTKPGGNDSGVYVMYPKDRFAVLRDAPAATANQTAQSIAPGASTRVPKVIAVMLEPDGQSRFFHPEASRRAGRPIWQPLQKVGS